MPDLKVYTYTGGETSLKPETIDAFKGMIRGAVLTADSSAYDGVRKIWNPMIDKRPALIVRCAGAAARAKDSGSADRDRVRTAW